VGTKGRVAVVAGAEGCRGLVAECRIPIEKLTGPSKNKREYTKRDVVRKKYVPFRCAAREASISL
jgi:hypothetical protein